MIIAHLAVLVGAAHFGDDVYLAQGAVVRSSDGAPWSNPARPCVITAWWAPNVSCAPVRW